MMMIMYSFFWVIPQCQNFLYWRFGHTPSYS